MLQPSDEIKSKLDIIEVIREYIPLKAAGMNFRALCPFHHEKTPSFMASPERQIWHCFGCGKGGDIFSFVMEIEGISFAEALRLLAHKAGVTLRRADPALASQRNRLLDIVELTGKYYHKILMERKEAEAARSYLAGRCLSEDSIINWRIGYSLDSWDNLVIFLKSKGFKENEIFLAGLTVKAANRPGFYDRFRGRIMFPLNDVNGNTVGFTARVSPEKEAEEKLGKYINTPQTMIYDKSKILFGLDKARLAIKSQDASVLMEGQMDVITAHQNGFTNAVAVSGTALTSDQVTLLKRYSNNLNLAFDMDRAGDLASERGIAQAMAAEMNIKVIKMPQGKDPDECIRRDPEGWRRAISEAKPVMQYYFDKTFSGVNVKEPDGQREGVKILLPIIAKLGSAIERDFWIKKLSQLADVGENFLREMFYKTVGQEAKQPAAAAKGEPVKSENFYPKQKREEMLSELLLALILKCPTHVNYIINHIGENHLVGNINQAIYRNLIIYYNNIIDSGLKEAENEDFRINCDDFKGWMAQSRSAGQSDEENNFDKQITALNRLLFLADKDFYEYSSQEAKGEIINIIAVLKKNYIAGRLKEVTRMIAQCEREEGQDGGKLKELMEEFKILAEELSEI